VRRGPVLSKVEGASASARHYPCGADTLVRAIVLASQHIYLQVTEVGISMRPVWFVCLIAPVVLFYCGVLTAWPSSAFAEDTKPHAKVIPFESRGKAVQPLLSGPPETVTMKSGLVTLAPGQSVGKHSTGQHEEMLVILAGQGEMIFKDGSKLGVAADHALYCPPETEHDVKNTGSEALRYVYVVASTK